MMVVHPQWPSNIRLVWPRMTQSRSTHSSVDDLQKAIMYLKIFSNGLGWLGGQQGRNNRINPAIFISITAVSGSQFVLYFTWRLVFTCDEKNLYHLNSQTDWRHCHIPRNHQLMDINHRCVWLTSDISKTGGIATYQDTISCGTMDIEPWCVCGWHPISVKLVLSEAAAGLVQIPPALAIQL